MNAASCSVNNNPLAQFNKHAQDNNSHLQQGSMAQRGGPSATPLYSPDQFKTTMNTISETSKAQMNHFMNGPGSNMGVLPSPSSSASLQLGNMNPRPTLMGQLSPQHTSFSSNHVPTLQSRQEHHQIKSPSSTSLNTMRHEWSQEFQHHNQSNVSMNSSMFMNQQQQQQPGNMTPMHYQPLHHTPSNYNIYGNSNASFRQSQRQPSNKDMGVSTSTTNWDQQFNDLEIEVSKALNINDSGIKEEIESNVNEQDTKNLEDQDIVIDDDYQAEFQHVWDSIHQDAEDIMPNYLNGQRFFDQRTELGNIKYDFEDSKNEYLNNPNAYEIGCILMENGAKLSEAAMAFEAAVKENSKHVDAWLKLGLVQIQNEKEINGISALENCLKLDPQNLEAMKNLAISYINEGYDSSAFTILNKWIETKYPQLDTIVPEVKSSSENESGDSLSLNEKITKRFLRLANQLPQVDPDVQLCLGLLFYANDDFDKTIDCFKAALKVNPNDELMWNRLGAALANSNRSEGSIKAYHRALQLKPSFVRARYNLAVSSMNIGCYKEAVEHLLTSLRMHEVEGMKQMEKNNTNIYDNYNNDNIIETLKRAFIAMDRNDLLQKVSPGMDLNQFRSEFKF